MEGEALSRHQRELRVPAGQLADGELRFELAEVRAETVMQALAERTC